MRQGDTYCDIIQRYYSVMVHPRDGLSGIMTHQLMKLWIIDCLDHFGNQISYLISLTMRIDNDDHSLNDINI